MSTAIVAFGGNALVTDAEHDSIPQQYETVSRTVPPLIDMVEKGWKLVVSHGNGPQVGFILRRSELAEAEVDQFPSTMRWPTPRARSATCSSRHCVTNCPGAACPVRWWRWSPTRW